MQILVNSIRDTIKTQFNIAWELLEYHLSGIADEKCCGNRLLQVFIRKS